MNTIIIYSSVRYLRTFNLVVSLSTHIHDQTVNIVYSDTKLERAFDKGDLKTIRTLIHLTQDTKLLKKKLKETIYYFEITKIILDHEPSLIHYDHDLIFRMYCERSDLKCCKILMQYKPNLRTLDDYIFKFAFNKYDNYKFIKWLFKQLEPGHKRIRTDLFDLPYNRKCLKVIKLFMKYDATYIPEIESICCMLDHEIAFDIMDYILDKRDSTTMLAELSLGFQEACYNGNYKVVTLLLEYDEIDVSEGLINACTNYQNGIVYLIIDIYEKGSDEINSALHISIQQGNYDIVKLLLKNGGNIQTVADAVDRCKSKEIKELIDKHSRKLN